MGRSSGRVWTCDEMDSGLFISSLPCAICMGSLSVFLPYLFVVSLLLISVDGRTPACEKAFESLDPITTTFMFDYAGKVLSPPGDLGRFDNCRTLPDTHYYTSAMTLGLSGMMNTTSWGILLGVCLPTACTEDDAVETSSTIVSLLSLNQIGVHSAEASNEISPGPLPARSIVVLTFIGVLALLCLIGTVLDYPLNDEYGGRGVQPYDDREQPLLSPFDGTDKPTLYHRLATGDRGVCAGILRILMFFSVRRNTRRLLAPMEDRTLAPLNALRVMSILWVIFGHTTSFMVDVTPTNNSYLMDRVITRMTAQFIIGALFSVDSFFYLSGFLLAFLTLRELRRKGRINWIVYVVHRYWRLTPLLGFVLLFFVHVAPYCGAGPMWRFMKATPDNCHDKWWTLFLYINNFYPSENPLGNCMGWAWYLANDMQFFLVAPVLMYAYYRSRPVGWLLLITALMGCWGANIGLVEGYDIYFTDEALGIPKDYWTLIYPKPYTRMAPFLVGMATAYLWLERSPRSGNEDDVLARKPAVRYCLFLLSTLLLLVTIYGMYAHLNRSGGWSHAESLLWITFSRSGFSIGVAILTYLMMCGYGGLVRDFFTWMWWDPLARLTYGVYLCHPIIIISVYLAHARYPNWDSFTISVLFVGFSVLAFCTSFVMYLLVEKPAMNLEKLWLPSRGGGGGGGSSSK